MNFKCNIMKKKLKQILLKRRSPRKKMMDADDEQEDEYARVTITTRSKGVDEKHEIVSPPVKPVDSGKEKSVFFHKPSAAQDYGQNNDLQQNGVVPMGSKLPASSQLSLDSRQVSFAAESVSSVDLESVGNESLTDANMSDRVAESSVASTTTTKMLPSKRNNQISSQLSLDERTLCFERLKLFEASRRAVYGPKLRSSSAYWSSFKEMLRHSLDETIHVDQLIRAAVLADLNYANHFRAAVQGTLKPDGSPMQQQPTSSKDPAASARSSSTSQSKVTTNGDDDERPKKNDKIYSPYLEYLHDVSLRFDEEAKSMQDGIGSQITNLREKLDGEVSSMIRLGDFIHEQLKSIEEAANDNWSCYYESSFKSLSGTERNDDGKASSDLWLLECNYIITVQYQTEAWSKYEPELCKMFSSMKEMELFRRSLIKEILTWAMQHKDRMYLGLQKLAEPSLEKLSKHVVDSNIIDEELKQSIRAGAYKDSLDSKQVVKVNVEGETELNVDDNAAVVEGEVDNGYMLDMQGNIAAPLNSVLIKNMKVIQRKVNRLGAGWKTALAIITADSVMHLFDAPSSAIKEHLEATAGNGSDGGSNIDASIQPDFIFQSLLPHVSLPTKESLSNESMNKGANSFFASLNGSTNKAVNLNIVPEISIILPNSTVSYTEGSSDENSNIEIVEICQTRGASKLLHKTSQRKVLLRASSRQQAMDIIYHMNVANFLVKEKAKLSVVSI